MTIGGDEWEVGFDGDAGEDDAARGGVAVGEAFGDKDATSTASGRGGGGGEGGGGGGWRGDGRVMDRGAGNVLEVRNEGLEGFAEDTEKRLFQWFVMGQHIP